MAGNSVSISLDIEACGEIVLSIGACTFSEETGQTFLDFYGCPSMKEQITAGLKPDESAFRWWLKQDEAARRAVYGTPSKPVVETLNDLRLWWPDKNARTWCYPTSYDLPVLARVFDRFGVRPPWKWTETMDARTLWKLAMERKPGIERIEAENPVPHHALEDAKEQARWVAAYLGAIHENK